MDDIYDPWDTIVNNKLAVHLLFDRFSTHLPVCYGMLDGGGPVAHLTGHHGRGVGGAHGIGRRQHQ